MIAKYDARCGICDEKIYEGDEIEMFLDEWCHKQCVDEEWENEEER